MAHNSVPDSHRDLLEREFLTLATVGEDGYPQVSEVWFLAEEGQVAMSLNTRRQKAKNLETEPACTVLLLDLQNPTAMWRSGAPPWSSPTTTAPSQSASAPSTTPICASTTLLGIAASSCGSSPSA